MNSKHALRAIDLFSGCGGLTLGLKQAGYKVVAAVEIEAKAQATYASNHPEVLLYRKDIRLVSADDILCDLKLTRGRLDLLAGCPPCQGFSRLRTRNKARSIADPRNDLVAEFSRLVEGLLPRTVMLENVPGLASDRRFRRFCRKLSNLGYESTFKVLDASEYGVPQRRHRLIFLASRNGIPVIKCGSGKRLTVSEAIGGMESPLTSSDTLHALPERRSEKVRKLIALIPKDGGSRTDLCAVNQLDCHKRNNGFFDVYGRMAWDKVSPTITSGCHNPSKGRFLHPTEDRAITLREAAILQGFPRTYQFDIRHGKEAIALMIGNALPPPFIAAHAAGLCIGGRKEVGHSRKKQRVVG